MGLGEFEMEITSEVVLRFNLNGDSYEGKAMLVPGHTERVAAGKVLEQFAPVDVKVNGKKKRKYTKHAIKLNGKRKFPEPSERTWKIAKLNASGKSAVEISKVIKYPVHVVYSAMACIKRRLKANGPERGLGLGTFKQLVEV